MSKAAELLQTRDFVTSAGTETYLVYLQGFPLRDFCAFEIYENPEELAKLESGYLHPLLEAAAAHGQGLLLDSLLWRASPDYIERLGYSPAELERINRHGVAATRASAERWARERSLSSEQFPLLVAADIGPRGDGYQCADADLTSRDAHEYHARQLEALAGADVDIALALTMTSANEAIGIVEAAAAIGLPAIVSPTVETDGRLPDGTLLADFVRRVDDATGGSPIYYMVNCAHPEHLLPTLEAAAERAETWLERFKGFRANASRLSHEELDNSTELDRGDPKRLAEQIAAMKQRFGLKLVGGCCGTDHEHIEAIASRVGSAPAG